jgi:hypothetical protein
VPWKALDVSGAVALQRMEKCGSDREQATNMRTVQSEQRLGAGHQSAERPFEGDGAGKSAVRRDEQLQLLLPVAAPLETNWKAANRHSEAADSALIP